jgi:hypothetical protein
LRLVIRSRLAGKREINSNSQLRRGLNYDEEV